MLIKGSFGIQALHAMKNLIKTRADAQIVHATIFESMLNRTGMSAEDMKLVLENNNVHQSENRIQQNRELVSMIDILLGGNLVFICFQRI
jgi:hypothetical protein